MKNVIDIGSIKMPKEAATKGFALIGKRGSGKTYNGAVIAEEFAKIWLLTSCTPRGIRVFLQTNGGMLIG